MSFEYTNIDNLNVNTINNNPYPPTKISTVTTLTTSPTITAAQLVGGIINCVGSGNGYTLDTSANITAAFNPTIVGQTFQVFFSNNGVYFSPGDSNTNLYCGSTAQSLVGPTSSTIAHFVYTGGTGWNVYF